MLTESDLASGDPLPKIIDAYDALVNAIEATEKDKDALERKTKLQETSQQRMENERDRAKEERDRLVKVSEEQRTQLESLRGKLSEAAGTTAENAKLAMALSNEQSETKKLKDQIGRLQTKVTTLEKDNQDCNNKLKRKVLEHEQLKSQMMMRRR